MTGSKPTRNTMPQGMDNTTEALKAPANPAEEKALKDFKKFQAMPNDDLAKKAGVGEDFVKKYPNSMYAQPVYSFLTVAYIQTNNMDKGVASGEKDLQLKPGDTRIMAYLGQALARTVTGDTPDAAGRLAKSEDYAKKAIAQTWSAAKPETMSEADFAAMNKDILAMSHGTLGLIAIRKNSIDAAIPELEQAVQTGSNEDPTNLYLLGVAYQNSGHPDKALPNLEKCAAVKGTNLTATCASLAEQSKKDAGQAPAKP
ncbi:MAG TPA: hypothetical protein VLC94_06235 [Candidatus Acidoferrum sp.]|nr:hypothetical protein [Candidatus Acidoferrum sp.]